MAPWHLSNYTRARLKEQRLAALDLTQIGLQAPIAYQSLRRLHPHCSQGEDVRGASSCQLAEALYDWRHHV